MVVKDKIGRRRYIIAKNEKKLIFLMNDVRSIDKKSKIIFTTGDFAVIFCRHWYKDKIVELLKSKNVKTYYTTGTIKRARRVIKVLQEDGGGGGGGY